MYEATRNVWKRKCEANYLKIINTSMLTHITRSFVTQLRLLAVPFMMLSLCRCSATSLCFISASTNSIIATSSLPWYARLSMRDQKIILWSNDHLPSMPFRIYGRDLSSTRWLVYLTNVRKILVKIYSHSFVSRF